MTALKQHEIRFWRRVNRRGGLDACWPFIGFLNRGYGQVVFDKVTYRAHRLAAYYSGLIPDPLMEGRSGGFIHQTCGNTACCNPDHMVIVPSSRSRKPEVKPLPDHGLKPPYNDEQKRLIASYYKSREWTQMQLAKGFHISQTQVHQIIQKYL